MKTLTLERKADSARPVRSSASRPTPEILAQRSSTLGGGGSVAAPAIVDAGRPLDAATRNTMEGGFGRDFSGIRVHDDARAHDDARLLGARAYAAGDHIVFGEGAYRPGTQTGRALIAHELAHSVQQGGVQMKADGSIPAGRDAELEAQADRAALDVTAGRHVSGLSPIGRPAIFRADGDPPAAAPATTATAGSAGEFPTGVDVIEETPVLLALSLPLLTLPRVKGKGAWVQQAYSAIAAGNRLVFNPIFTGPGMVNTSVSAYMEKPSENYKNVWLNNFGFTNLKSVADGFTAAAADPAADPEVKTAFDNPSVKSILAGFSKNHLPTAHCDIDHIVEKQLGGASVSGNMQVLLSDKNQASGRDTYQQLVNDAKLLLAKRSTVTTFQMRFRDARVPEDVEDGSFLIETLLRQGKVKGSEEVKKKGEGTPVLLLAGGASEAVRVRATGSTPIDSGERRLISGMKLLQYNRGAGSTPTAGTDTIDAEIQSKPVIPGPKKLVLLANVAPAPAVADPSTGAAAAEKAAATEIRQISLDKTKNADLTFLYPYLSAGKFTKLAIDEQNRLIGEGVITPSVKFLGQLKVTFGPDQLALVQDINTEAINSSAFMKLATGFRFTSGSISIDLLKFQPQGTLEMEVGPKGKPVVLGTVTATAEGGSFIAKGTLRPGGTIPGITEAQGEVSYRSDTGWAGVLSANSTSIPNSTASIKLGFKEDKGVFRPYAEGAISTNVRDKGNLTLKIGWGGGSVSYSATGSIKNPMPLVQSVDLNGSYANGLLSVTGTAPITWRKIDSTMTVTYTRKDGEEGKFSGKATIAIKNEKAEGSLKLAFDEAGSFSGSGSISYQVTKDLRPTLGVEFAKERLRMFGEVAVADVALTKKWPGPDGGRLQLFSVGVPFKVPTPVPPINATITIKVSGGLAYGVGPVMLKGLTFKGELYPLEEDPKVKATLVGKFAVPAYGEIYGTFGALIGLEVAGGAVGAQGGVEVTPALRIEGEGGIDFEAAYEAYAFTFAAEAYAKGRMIAKLKVDLVADIYAGYGLISHKWTYNVGGLEKRIGPELKLTLGKIAYGKGGEITWPSASQISLEPKDLELKSVLKDLLREGDATKV